MEIKKITTYFALALLLSTSQTHNAATILKLESAILAQVDGLSIGIDGETFALLKQYDSKLLELLVGKRDASGKRAPQYTFDGKLYTMQQLSIIEEQQGHTQELSHLLRKIRTEFEKMSLIFRTVARGTKPIMAILIEESCAKRGRLHNSILYIWAKTDEAMEEELFDVHIKSLKDLETFLIDLHNFLNDLMCSCPKAAKQFQEKVAKFNKLRNFVANLGISKELEMNFLKQINQLLGKMKLEEITPDRVRTLVNDFKNKK